MQTPFDLIDLPANDRDIMNELLDVHPGRSFEFYCERLQKIFIKPSAFHYMFIGFIMGHLQGAQFTRQQIFNNLSKCKEN